MSARWRSSVLVALAGAVLVVIAAVAVGAKPRDTVALLVVTGSGAFVAAAVARLVTRSHGPRSLRHQVIAISVTATMTMVGGITAASRAMFLSRHDLDVLVIVTVMSATVSVLAAMRTSDRFRADSDRVAALSDTLVAGALGADGEWHVAEMRELAERLSESSVQLERANERERALERSRRELISWVSHDLRSPIASIRAMAEALEDGLVDDSADVTRYHRAIQAESLRLGRLVDDLFELSRIQAGSARPPSGVASLAEVVDEAIRGQRVAAETQGVGLHAELNEAASASVPGADLTRIVANLLDNAVRHTAPGGSVHLDAAIDAGSIVLTVRDGCGGIPSNDLPRVFDAAFRGDPARTVRSGGGGLGLTIAHGLAVAHDGTISVANEGPGCRFTVVLPAAPRPGSDADADAQVREPSDSRS